MRLTDCHIVVCLCSHNMVSDLMTLVQALLLFQCAEQSGRCQCQRLAAHKRSTRPGPAASGLSAQLWAQCCHHTSPIGFDFTPRCLIQCLLLLTHTRGQCDLLSKEPCGCGFGEALRVHTHARVQTVLTILFFVVGMT